MAVATRGGKTTRLIHWVIPLIFLLVLSAVRNDKRIVTKFATDAAVEDEDQAQPHQEEQHNPLWLISDNLNDVFASESSPLHSTTAKGRDLVVIFVDSPDLLDTLSVWLHYYKKQPTKRILCLLAVTQDVFNRVQTVLESNQHNIQDNLGPTIVTLANGKKGGDKEDRVGADGERVQLLRRLADTFPGNNILLTDVNALWLRDIQPMLLDHQQSHIVASRDIGRDAACSLVLAKDSTATTTGVIASFGFVYFRNSVAIRTLLRDVVEAKANNNNDDLETAFNCILAKDYDTTADSSVVKFDGSIVQTYQQQPSANSNNEKGNSVTLTLLSYSQVMRNCPTLEAIQNVTVAHCSTLEKEGASNKMERLQALKITDNGMIMYQW